MGCGGSRNKNENNIIRDRNFIIEAFKADKKLERGLVIDENKNIQSCKVISDQNPAFMEELLDHADESGSVKPWLNNMVPPEEELIENKEIPSESLKIEHVFGYRSYDVRHNLFFVNDEHIAYTTGALGVVQNKNNLSQKIFGGLEWDESASCHDDMITSVAYYGGSAPMIATGQRKNKPIIHVWSPNDTTKVLHTIHLLKGSKEVSRLAFDYKGEFLFAAGRDKLNSFYFFNLQTKSKYWMSKTGENILFDVALSPNSPKFCIVGVKTIIFGDYSSKTLENQSYIREDLFDNTFTAVCFTKQHCLIATQSGKILIWLHSKYLGEVKAGSTAIHVLYFNERNNTIYASDSDKKIYTFLVISSEKANEILKLRDTIDLSSIAKAIDINSIDEMVIGLKHGKIMLKDSKNPNRADKVIIKSHYSGKVSGLSYVPDKYVITTGEDNRLMVWNIEKKACEAIAYLNDRTDSESDFDSKHCSKTISYCPSLNHIAIGLNNGEISIRNGLKSPNDRLMSNIRISQKEIENVKYSPNGIYLAVASNAGEFYLLNTKQNYNISFKLKGHESPVIQLDWDQTSGYIQAVTLENEYLFYEVKSEKIVASNSKL
jgi:WD40 repeat protein